MWKNYVSGSEARGGAVPWHVARSAAAREGDGAPAARTLLQSLCADRYSGYLLLFLTFRLLNDISNYIFL